MRMFVWEYLEGITHNYHDGGGVVAIAKDLERAQQLVGKPAKGKAADYSTSVGTTKEKVFIFPDAGCC